MKKDARALLEGAIDLHVHSYPDVIARKFDDIELVEAARECTACC